MGMIDELVTKIHQQTGKRYRLVRLDPENVSRKKIEGFEFVNKADPSVKGTILEHHQAADGMIKIGNLGLAHIPEEAAKVKEKKNLDRQQRQLDAIKHGYRKSGEEIKRALGASHKAFNVVVDEGKDKE
jgi:hypothetical protein